MRVLLVNPNTGNANTKPPLGLMSIGTVCEQHGHQVQLLDAALYGLPAEEAAKYADGYDVICLTAMTPYIREAELIASKISKPVVIGGVHSSVFPWEVYKTGLFKAVVVGEGERVILGVLDDIQNGKSHGIYQENEGVYAQIPVIDYSLIDITAYKPRYPHARRLPWVPVSISRGCPYRCTFCVNIFGKKHRAMPYQAAAVMLRVLAHTYGVKDITFYDDEFTINRYNTMRFCSWLEAQHIDLEWTCEARVDSVDVELLGAMRRAGCRLIYYGLESGNQDILNTLNKRATLEQAREAAKATRNAGIMAAGYFMLGCPNETIGTMRQTVEFAKELELDHAQFSMCVPLPGSELYKASPAYDWHEYNYLGQAPKAKCNNELSIEQIEKAVNEANDIWQKTN